MTTSLTPFDAYEIHGCRMLRGEIYDHYFVREHVEQCDDDEAQFWSLLGHVTGEGLHSVGDFSTREEAFEIQQRIECLDVHKALARRRQIAIIWSLEDVLEVRPDLSEDQAWEVLQSCRPMHDANDGITWDSIEVICESLFPADESSDAEGL